MGERLVVVLYFSGRCNPCVIFDIETQCVGSSSGYNSEARQAVKLKYATVEKTQSATPWTRQNPFDFTGCLAHVEVTEFDEDGAVKAIVGHLEHNPACQAARIKRLPAVPLHPHVYDIALEQLKSGARYDSDSLSDRHEQFN